MPTTNPFGDIPRSVYDDQPLYIRVLNGSGEIIPPWAVMEITSYDKESNRYTVNKPSITSRNDMIVFNDRVPIAVGASGQAVAGYPAPAAFRQTLAMVAIGNGQTVGVVKDSWYLNQQGCGYITLDVANASRGVLIVIPQPRETEFVLVSTTRNSDGDYQGTVQRYNPATGAWESGETVWVRDAN